jgi:hypothetical protein
MQMNSFHRIHQYQILIEGVALKLDDERLAGWSADYTEEGNTLLSADAADSAALYGALAALRDGGFVLLDIHRTHTREDRVEERKK